MELSVVRNPSDFEPANRLRLILAEFMRWVLFLLTLWIALRPMLQTTIAADDFINPFSQLYQAGASLPRVLRESWANVTSNGHLNYGGQSLGAIVLFIWLYLIGKIGIHYGTVYAISKFVVYLVAILVVAEVVRYVARQFSRSVSRWHARLFALMTVILLLQIHIPWSNDPVASYPLAGYATVALGLLFLLVAHKALLRRRLSSSILTSVLGVFVVQYYEFNIFALLAIGPLTLVLFFEYRAHLKVALQYVSHSLIIVLPGILSTAVLYFRNKEQSVNYGGTAVTFGGEFLSATRIGLLGSLPGSSWSRANDWLPRTVLAWSEIVYFALGILLVAGMLWSLRRCAGVPPTHDVISARYGWAFSVGLGIYWIGATITQTITEKVQREVAGIGQVYNFYAVGATCFGILLAVTLIRLAAFRSRLAGVVMGLLIMIGGYQYVLNANVRSEFNRVMSPNANLLNVYHEVRDMNQRCQALTWWKSLGWPEYYSTHMQEGMNLSYIMYRGEPFCEE